MYKKLESFIMSLSLKMTLNTDWYPTETSWIAYVFVMTQEEHSLYILTESSRQDTGQKYQTVWHGNQSRDWRDKPGVACHSMHMHEQVSKVSRAHC